MSAWPPITLLLCRRIDHVLSYGPRPSQTLAICLGESHDTVVAALRLLKRSKLVALDFDQGGELWRRTEKAKRRRRPRRDTSPPAQSPSTSTP